jgi:hypothetical protein
MVLFLLNTAHPVFGENFFVDCDKAMKKKVFSPLKIFLEDQSLYSEIDGRVDCLPKSCFRLNENEFLLTIPLSHNFRAGLYYVNLKNNNLILHGDVEMPNIEVQQEFTGKNKKRYALFSWGTLWHGIYSREYGVLNLVLKTKGKPPYVLYNIYSAHESDSGLCGKWVDKNNKTGKTAEGQDIKEGKAHSVKRCRIENYGTDNVQIVFDIQEQNCLTLEKREYKKIVGLVDGVFR